MAVDIPTINAAMKARFSEDLLGDLTNQGDENWSIIKEVTLNAACSDGIQEFQIMTGCTYGVEDREDAEINIIVSFTMYKLYQYAQNTEMMLDYERLLDNAIENFLIRGNTIVSTNKAHASDNRPQDNKGYKTSKSQIDASDLTSDISPYVDPSSPYRS